MKTETEKHSWRPIKNRRGIGKGWTHQCARCGRVTDNGGRHVFKDGCLSAADVIAEQERKSDEYEETRPAGRTY